MKTSKKTLLKLVITMTLIHCISPFVTAQEYASTQRKTFRAPDNFSIDTAFVGKNMRDNKMEIDLSQLALQRSTNQAVKKIAQLMITDHTNILNDLSKIAQNNNMLALAGYPTNGVASGTASDSINAAGNKSTSTVDKTNNNTSSKNTGSYNNLGTTGTRTAAGSGGAAGTTVDGQNQTSSSANNGDGHMKMQGAAMLQTASGAAFDKLWIPQMLSMHEAKLSELTSIADTINDSDLKTAVNSAIPKIKMHRDMLSAMKGSNSRN